MEESRLSQCRPIAPRQTAKRAIDLCGDLMGLAGVQVGLSLARARRFETAAESPSNPPWQMLMNGNSVRLAQEVLDNSRGLFGRLLNRHMTAGIDNPKLGIW